MTKQLAFIIITLILFANWDTYSQNTNPCLAMQDFRIVVLGSSTAAGAGVSSSDSAWVNRYRNHLQSINPDNEVINLAVGGFTSYKIMPTTFNPPAGRPSPDTSKNITTALGLMPDAIIVNLPSNDIASGYSLEEQIFNLDSIFQQANSNDVPIWISTTQPKNMSAAKMQLQAQMRDSINAHYGSFAVDFWSDIALPDNSVNPIFDSGDGTHLNDTAHGVLCNRVIAKDILSYLFVPGSIPDYGVFELSNNVGPCGNANSVFEAILVNVGANDFGTINCKFKLKNTAGFTVDSAFTQLINGLNTCETDTVVFYTDLTIPGSYSTIVHLHNANDINFSNDTIVNKFSILGIPSVQIKHDTLCEAGLGYLEIEYEPGDTAFWYDDPISGSIIHTGESYLPGWIDSSTVWYADVVRGDLFYRGDIYTTSQSNINWNGVMFDLVATQSLAIDSLDIKIATLGWQQVEIYSKSGSYKGAEMDATQWSLLNTVSVLVNDVDDFTTLTIDSFILPPIDTVGIYIQMATSSSRLSYKSMGAHLSRSNSEISIITGTGIGHNWASMYPHRDLNCRVHYHFGFNPSGTCSTGRQPVYAFVSDTTLFLGPDTIIDLDSNFTLTTSGFANHIWSNGETNSSLGITANDYGLGIHEFWLAATDSFNCIYSDTILIEIVDMQSNPLVEHEESPSIFPNPSKGLINVLMKTGQSLTVYNSQGKNVYKTFKSGLLDLQGLPKGIYLFSIRENNDSILSRRIVLK